MKAKVIKRAYRSVIPQSIQTRLDMWRQDRFLKDMRINILKHFNEKDGSVVNYQIEEVLSFLRKNPLHMFPYDFIYKYDAAKINVLKDSSTELNYVFLGNKKLFYPEGWSSENIQYSHSFSCLEQDKQSPHSYQDESINYGPNDVVVDAGSAEGNFSLEIVEKVKKVYLFECSDGWHTPLKKTFEPWGDKVEIIPLKLSSTEDLSSTTLDRFFENKEPPTILKIDVDGDEKSLLEGAKNLLKDLDYLRIALCVYHKKNDEAEFTNLLQNLKFSVKTSHGYMIFYLDEPLQEPYLRRALLFASKG